MQSQLAMSQSYNKIVKKIKTFTMIGEFIIFIIRVLAQRIFSVYIGIVLFQFILVTQMTFKTYCVIESKFYLIMNCILFYLLMINFVESEINQTQTIQYVLKDKYIIDYVKIGYPIEFFFRLVATLLMWRVYQYSRMKTIQYGDVLDSEQIESNTHRNDRIHVRENTHEQDGLWALNVRQRNQQNERNLSNSQRNSQYHQSNIGNLSRQISNRQSQADRINQNSYQSSHFRNSGVESFSVHNSQQLNQSRRHRPNFVQILQNIQPQSLNNNQSFQQFHQPLSLAQNTNHVTFQLQNPPQSRVHSNQQTH